MDRGDLLFLEVQEVPAALSVPAEAHLGRQEVQWALRSRGYQGIQPLLWDQGNQGHQMDRANLGLPLHLVNLEGQRDQDHQNQEGLVLP